MMRPTSMGAREQYFRELRVATFMVSSYISMRSELCGLVCRSCLL